MPKKPKDFVFQAVYGIVARQSVRLTEIAEFNALNTASNELYDDASRELE